MVNNSQPSIDNHGYLNQGIHKGDVSFQMHEAPPDYHPNSIRCPQCEDFTWRNTPNCVHCGNDIKLYLWIRRIKWDISCKDYRINILGKWLLGSVVVIIVSIFFNVLWLALIGFIAACIQSEMMKKLECDKKQLKHKLYEIDY